MLESMGSAPTRIVIESGEEGVKGGESSSGGFKLAVEELLPSESPMSLICAVSLLERGT